MYNWHYVNKWFATAKTMKANLFSHSCDLLVFCSLVKQHFLCPRWQKVYGILPSSLSFKYFLKLSPNKTSSSVPSLYNLPWSSLKVQSTGYSISIRDFFTSGTAFHQRVDIPGFLFLWLDFLFIFNNTNFILFHNRIFQI